MGLAASEIPQLEATTLRDAIRTKNLSPVEVVDAIVQRVEQLDPVVHAFCTFLPDAARADARRLEAEQMAGRDIGPLAGVPISIKDLLALKGVRMSAGSMAYAEFVPHEDDVVVERLKAADAIVLGKTNVPEFGYAATGHNCLFQTTRNPWNSALTPGGSSAGSAAAVASGMGPLSIGTDGGGSVRIPASFCGLFGFKPSMGRIPLHPSCRDEKYPGISSWETLEHVGPISRTVADSALLLSVVVGPDERDRHSLPTEPLDWLRAANGELPNLRIAYTPDWGYAKVDPEVLEIVGRAARVFEVDLGCSVEEATPALDDLQEIFWGVAIADSDLEGMRAMAARHSSHMMPHLVASLEAPWTAEDLTRASVGRKAVCNEMWKFMRDYDLLLTPTVAVPPFPIDLLGPGAIGDLVAEPHEWLPFTAPMNLTGQPAATVPAGWTRNGLPVGLQVAGRHLDDVLVLRASAAFETVAPWKNRWPALVDNIVKDVSARKE